MRRGRKYQQWAGFDRNDHWTSIRNDVRDIYWRFAGCHYYRRQPDNSEHFTDKSQPVNGYGYTNSASDFNFDPNESYFNDSDSDKSDFDDSDSDDSDSDNGEF